MSGPNYMAVIGKGKAYVFGRPKGKRPTKAQLVRLYVKEGLSLRATGEALGLSKDVTRAALAEYRIKRRSGLRTAKLSMDDLAAILTERVEDHRPWKDIAKRHGVSTKTLERFIKKAKARNVTPRTLKGATRRAWKSRDTWTRF